MSKGVISWPVKIFSKLSIVAKLFLYIKDTKLGVQLPNYGYNNQSCHILMVTVNLIYKVRIPKYSLYCITLLYTNVSIFTVLWECAADESDFCTFLRIIWTSEKLPSILFLSVCCVY